MGARHLLQALWLASKCGQSATVLQGDSMMMSSFLDATGSGCAHRREADRCGSVHIGEKLTDVVLLPAVARACESGTTEPSLTREESGALKEQLLKWCESVLLCC